MGNHPKPIPEVTPENEEFFKGCGDGKLKVQRCRSCGTIYYYPRAICPECHSDNVEWIVCSGLGNIHTYTVVRQNGALEFRDEVPYVVAVVELEEGGVQMVTNVVNCAFDRLKVGMPVRVLFEKVSDDVSLPKFEPA